MANYLVKVSKAPKGHDIPALLVDFGAWMGKQKHGALGWFDGLVAEEIPKEWSEEHADLLRRNAFSFLTLGEGSMLALVKTGAKTPPAVALLGSEGDRRTVANSLEEFLTLWSKGETEIYDLDDDESKTGRRALGGWLKEKKVKTPKAKEFDFQGWLDEGVGAAAPPKTAAGAAPKAPKREQTAIMKKAGPKFRQLVTIMGRKVDEPDVINFVTKVLAKKVPATTSERSDDVNVEAPKAGVELAISHRVLNEAYPPVNKTAKSFIPYVAHAWVREKFGEPVLGIPWDKGTEADIKKVLGAPTSSRKPFDKKKPPVPCWEIEVDKSGIELCVEPGPEYTIYIKCALGLEEYVDVTTGLFVGWAASKGLLDEAKLAAHKDLIASIKKRKAKGSELVKAAMPRGLWDEHLKNDKELRMFAYGWFHNIGGAWITADLKKVFGKRPGPHGHDQPKLDDDTWDAVDKAAKVFAERFKKWL